MFLAHFCHRKTLFGRCGVLKSFERKLLNVPPRTRTTDESARFQFCGRSSATMARRYSSMYSVHSFVIKNLGCTHLRNRKGNMVFKGL